MKRHYYQVVSSYNKRLGYTYQVYTARKDDDNNIEIASIPLVLEGSHPAEIRATIRHILNDMKLHPVVEKDDCNIFHDNLWHED